MGGEQSSILLLAVVFWLLRESWIVSWLSVVLLGSESVISGAEGL